MTTSLELAEDVSRLPHRQRGFDDLAPRQRVQRIALVVLGAHGDEHLRADGRRGRGALRPEAGSVIGVDQYAHWESKLPTVPHVIAERGDLFCGLGTSNEQHLRRGP